MSTIEQPHSHPSLPRRKPEAPFVPKDNELLSSFESNGWMVIAGIEPVLKYDKPSLEQGSVVNKLDQMRAKARTLSPATLFEQPFIAFDPIREIYVAVHKRTPLGQAEWERANR